LWRSDIEDRAAERKSRGSDLLDVITKKEFWEWLDLGIVQNVNVQLKTAQDAYILSQLLPVQGSRICEIGGGNSRVLAALSENNECWLVDKFEGQGQGPTSVEGLKGINVVKSFMGDFDPAIPNDYFDFVFSISVVEHIPTPELDDVFADCGRIMKAGAKMLHAVDIYVYDEDDKLNEGAVQTRLRLKRYLELPDRLVSNGIRLTTAPHIDTSLTYSCHYASNPMNVMYNWNTVVPQYKGRREIGECISLKYEWVKPAIPSSGQTEAGYR
jgi:hypothetical protein